MKNTKQTDNHPFRTGNHPFRTGPARLPALVTVLLAVLLLTPAEQSGAQTFTLEAETGGLWFSRNDVRIPNEGGTRFDMIDLIGSDFAPYYRLRLNMQILEHHKVRILFAPLTKSGTGIIVQEGPVLFANSEFASGIPLKGTYRFNTYRITYRYTFYDRGPWKLGAGLAGLIRDAKVQLVQDGRSDQDTDLGFVPLVHLFASRTLTDRLWVQLDAETLAGPQGRATDAALTVHYHLRDHLALFTGYRVLEGGADVDQVYNFSWINFLPFGLIWTF